MTNVDIIKIVIVILELIFLALGRIFYKNNELKKSWLMNLIIVILFTIYYTL